MIIVHNVASVIEFLIVCIISRSIMRSVCSIDAILKTIIVIAKFQNIVHFSLEILVDYDKIRRFVDLIFERIAKILA